MIEAIKPRGSVMRSGLSDLVEDARLLATGKLDIKSFLQGYKRTLDPVQIEVRGADGKLKSLRRTHNLRTDSGGDLQAKQMAGDVAANGGVAGTSTGTTATTMTDSGKSWTVNMWTGHVVVVGSVFGVVLSNTATALTVDQWSALPFTGAAGSTPGATTAYAILPFVGAAMWIALSTDSVAPATTDTTLTSEQTTNGLNRQLAAFAHSAITGGTTTTVSGSYTLSKTFTSSGIVTGVQKSGIFSAQNGGVMQFENTFASVNVINGDTIAVTWTVNY